MKNQKKSIEFRCEENKTVLETVKYLKSVLNVRYHHHYLKGNGIIVLEYFDH